MKESFEFIVLMLFFQERKPKKQGKETKRRKQGSKRK